MKKYQDRCWRVPGLLLFIFITRAFVEPAIAQTTTNPAGVVIVTPVDSGWAGNSINAVVFRKNSLVSQGGLQFISFYDAEGNVVIGKRKNGAGKWQLAKTGFKGNIKDAHNSISIMIDGKGYVHLAWDHHNNKLNYSRSRKPLSLEMGDKEEMTGRNENSVSYPEVYKMPGGDLLFLYRDGGSGRGNLVINRYSIKSNTWSRIADNLIDGEGKRNAYWQCYLDKKGVFHISWVWRETPDVASNHDLCYARSKDGGQTWERSDDQLYQLPINASTAEYICRIPQKSELINQTSMSASNAGNPIIASYWKEANDTVPQYHIVYNLGGQWKVASTGFRSTAFTLSGTGTKRIPVSRPQVISWQKKGRTIVAVIFRDEERHNNVSVAMNRSLTTGASWEVFDLLHNDTGAWEPSYDSELWKQKQQINLFVQRVAQADAEGIAPLPPQMISVLEWNPVRLK